MKRQAVYLLFYRQLGFFLGNEELIYADSDDAQNDEAHNDGEHGKTTGLSPETILEAHFLPLNASD